MAVTKDDLQDFTRFADEKLTRGEGASIIELAGEWEAQRHETEATMADIRASHADIEAGQVASAADTFANVRNQLGMK